MSIKMPPLYPYSVYKQNSEDGNLKQNYNNPQIAHARTHHILPCYVCIVQSTIQIIRPVNINKMGFPFNSVLGGLGSLSFLFIIIVGLLFTLDHAPSAFSNYLPLSDNFF